MGSKYKEGKRRQRAPKTTPPPQAPRKFDFPVNVRQMGGINKGVKIYIEDYAYTYISKLGQKCGKEETALFLVGFFAAELGEEIVVISGAIKPPLPQTPEEGRIFSESGWRYAKDTVTKYFPGLELVGWARLQPGYGLYLSASDISGHYKEFAGKNSVLFLYDPEEKQSCFFEWSDGKDDLNEVAGYFIYYDKNQEMNAYITGARSGEEKDDAEEAHAEEAHAESEEPEEEAVFEPQEEDYGRGGGRRAPRAVENAKRLAEIQRQKRIISVMTSVSVMLFFACLTMGIGLLQNGERLSLMENQMRELRTGYNNIVSKLNNSVFPAFAAQTEQESPQAVSEPASAEVIVVESAPKTESEPPSLDEALGVTAAPPPPPEEETAAAEPVTYVVQPGDTLTYISNRFYGIPNQVAKIMEANGLTDPDKLIAGSTLIIPE